MYLRQVCPPNGGLSLSTNVVLPTATVHSRSTIVYHVFEVTGRSDLPLSGAAAPSPLRGLEPDETLS
jgi:hypothetical protein